MKVLNAFSILITILFCPVATEKGPCANFWNGCCPNTIWDSDNKTCIECPTGYYWVNCSRPCIYPYYGAKCANNCSCEIAFCNFMSGCNKGNESDVTNAVSSEKLVDGVDYMHNPTQIVSIMKPFVRKQNWLISALILATTVFAVLALAFFVLQIVEKYIKREVTA